MSDIYKGEVSSAWLATCVDMQWLDRVVAARRRLYSTGNQLTRLRTLVNRGDMEFSTYSEAAERVLDIDGTIHRYNALRRRHGAITDNLTAAEHAGARMGGVEIALTELEDVLRDTILNTETMLDEAADAAVEDPFIDRIEEHPAYERN